MQLTLKTILNHSPQIEVLAVGGNGLEGIALYEEHRPDIHHAQVQPYACDQARLSALMLDLGHDRGSYRCPHAYN